MFDATAAIATLAQNGYQATQMPDGRYQVHKAGAQLSEAQLEQFAHRLTQNDEITLPSFQITVDERGRGKVLMDGIELTTMSLDIHIGVSQVPTVTVTFPADTLNLTLPALLQVAAADDRD